MIVRVFDTESDGLRREATRLWCIATRDLDSRQEKFFGPDEIEQGLRYLMEADVIVAHNLLGHDLPLIQKLYPWFKEKAYEDSLILSRLYNPDRNGHSIEDWGKRLGRPKPVHEDWSQYSDDMRVRCIEDTRINCSLLRTLIREASGGDWVDATRTEYDAQLLQNQIEDHGFLLDIPAATSLADELDSKLDLIASDLQSYLPYKVEAGTTYDAPFTMAGKLKSNLAKWFTPEQATAVSGPLSKVEFIPFNFSSPNQVNAFLLAQGWEPNYFNYKKAKHGGFELNDDGTYVVSSPRLPKTTEDQSCLDTIKGEAGKLFIQYRVLKHRRDILRRVRKKDDARLGWLNEVRSDGRMEARAIPLGTNTGRYAHSGIVNVPSVGATYGAELRSCLTVPTGMFLSGTDASGLEARVAGHYTYPIDGGQYANELLEGDVHTKNATAYSTAANREIARSPGKNITYGIMFGATARKVATMVGAPLEVGGSIVDAFWDVNPALREVAEECQHSARTKGYIISIDGRRIVTRSPHSALNALIQSTGAIIMKNCFNYVHLNASHWHPVCTMHDEAQTEVLPQYANELADKWDEAGRWVTEKFNLNVPIEFETKVGKTYADTH